MANAGPVLGQWSTFYTMIGSSAAALTGLMFIVITLIAGEERLSKNPDGISAFSTPTVIHFATVLLVSAIMLVPWHVIICSATALGVIGLCGLIYVSRVAVRAARLLEYRADIEDWIWYCVLPFVAYASMLAGASMIATGNANGLFMVAGAAVLLTFIGIRNAWDVVTFLAMGGPKADT